MQRSERIEAFITTSVETLGSEIDRVQIVGWVEGEGRGEGDAMLQIMIERQDGAEMIVDYCAKVSRAISALLDVEDPVPGQYTLEVSSPGIDRPLTRSKDFETYAGFEVKIETDAPIDGRKRYRGRLLGIKDGLVRIELEEGERQVPMDSIHRAKLVLTDELLDFAGRSRD